MSVLQPRHLPPAGADAMCWATRIHRFIDIDQWKAAIAETPERFREQITQYLRGIYKRHLVAENMKAVSEAAKLGAKKRR